MTKQKDSYFVAVKVFLEHKGKFFITKDRFGDWDLPGGRLLKNEFATPLEKVVARKIKEELGGKLKYALGKPLVFMRHERNEILPDGTRALKRIFAIGYRARYTSGNILLGDNHVDGEWVSIKTFKPEKYFKGGWLRGVKEYLKLVR